ncbi:MAG: sulfotransferase [Gammaproteobacteria bacterium]|nr:sulfotransferase [Gammaproteobacteria bacterium]
MSTNEQRLIFLGGAPRSGTTLLQNILDMHPDILGGPEFLHLPDILQLRGKLRDSVARGWIDLICSAEEVDERMRNLIGGFLLTFADRHGAKLLSEKTPENVLVFPKLVELFPGSKFIHIVRDPRATVASLLEVGKKARRKGETPALFTRDAQSAIRHVRRCLDSGFSASRTAPDKVYTLVYERLIRDPEAEGRQICGFLGVSWAPEMLRPGEKRHMGESAITVNSKEIWYDAKTYNSNPQPDSLEKWRETLAAHEKLMIARAFSDSEDLSRLGYDFTLSDMGTMDRARGAVVTWLRGLRRRLGGGLRRLAGDK